jgi:hypothetical protein
MPTRITQEDQAEQAAKADPLAQLEAHATALETPPPPSDEVTKRAEAEQASEAASLAQDLTQALVMVRAMARPAFGWWEDFSQVWSDKALEGIGQAGALVMQRHGWTMGDLMTQWGPYIALIGATAPPVMVTAQAIKLRREQMQSQTTGQPPGGANGGTQQATH